MSTVEGIGARAANVWSSPAMQSLGSALTTYLQDKMLKKVDADGNGTVEQGEFRAAMEQLTSRLGVEMNEEDTPEVFASLDTDGDGALSGSELGQLIHNVFAASGGTQGFVAGRGDGAADFDALDADGDGTITRAEFDRVATQNTSSGTPSTSAQTDDEAADGQVAQANSAAVGKHAVLSEPMKALLASADANRNGQVSGGEVDRFIAQLAGQMQLALTQLNGGAAQGNRQG